jgi:ERCC4-type nuclease
MMIEIDNREHQLIHLLQQHDTGEQKHLTISTLQIGDIILCNKVIIERKSVADLYASILDGRYEEQSYRLGNLGPLQHNHNIIYLIEGDINRHKQKNMLMSAIFSISYYKGFSVMRTFNIQETADFIWNTFKKMTKEKNKRGFYEMSQGSSMTHPTTAITSIDETDSSTTCATYAITNQTTFASTPTLGRLGAEPQKDYVQVVKKCKKDNITENNIDEIMLCQIPGISTQSAIAIVKHLGGIRQLLQRHAEEGDAIFAGIKVANSTNGKESKLNKTIVQNLKRFLFKTDGAAAAAVEAGDVEGKQGKSLESL